MFQSLALAVILICTGAAAKDKPAAVQADFTRTQDVVYGRAYGTALTMDVFEPKHDANGATVIWVVSGGWFSSHDSIQPDNSVAPIRALIDEGYRVCAVVHRSNPYFNIEDAVADVTRSVRFIRHQATQDGHTTMPIGIMGSSAGGHLSLMAATTGDDGDPRSKDPVERTSSHIQAAACYFPPTDFLNYGDVGVNVLQTTVGLRFPAPFRFHEKIHGEKVAGLGAVVIGDITDPKRVGKILAEISPVTHISSDDAPTLIIHGDKDMLVPIQQSELMIKKLKEAGVKTRLVRKPGMGHGWRGIDKDNLLLIDWMNDHLLK